MLSKYNVYSLKFITLKASAQYLFEILRKKIRLEEAFRLNKLLSCIGFYFRV